MCLLINNQRMQWYPHTEILNESNGYRTHVVCIIFVFVYLFNEIFRPEENMKHLFMRWSVTSFICLEEQRQTD
jgi:hypothetical protein